MTAADVTHLFDLLNGAVVVCLFGIGYLGGYMQ